MRFTVNEYNAELESANALPEPHRAAALKRLDKADVVDDQGNPVDIKKISPPAAAAPAPAPVPVTADQVAGIVAKTVETEMAKAVASLKPSIDSIRVGEPAWMPKGLKLYSPIKSFTGTDDEKKRKAYQFGAWFLGGVMNVAKYAEKCKEMGIPIIKAHSEGSNIAGGVLVPEQIESTIIDLREQYGVFRQHTKIYPMVRDTMTVPRRTSGLTAYFKGEAAAYTESTKGWDNVSLTAKKLTALAKISSELLEDAIINVADDLASEIVYAFAKKEDDCGFIGDGTSTYGGIVGVSAAITNKWTSTTTDAAGSVIATGNLMSEVVAGDLLDVIARLPQYAAGNAKWFCSRYAWAAVFGRLTTAVTAGMAQTPDTLSGTLPMQWMGYPIVITQAMPASDTNSQIITFLGDLSMASTMGTRRETTISISDQVYWANDQVGIRGDERIDIAVHDVGDGTSAGPVVGLRAAAS